MGDNTDQNMKYQRKIDNILNSNKNLLGFYAFVSDSAISTVYNYLLHINSFLEYVGDKKLSELNEDDFRGYMAKIEINQKGENTTSSYKIAVYSALKKYGNYLVESGVLKNSPMNSITRPKAVDSQKTIEKRENGFLTKDEIQQLLNSIEKGVGSQRSKNRQLNWKERDLAIVILLLVTGMKCSDLIKLDVNNVDLENNILFVNNNVTVYDLSDETKAVLKRWLIKRKSLLNDQSEDALFISNRRERMNHGSIYKVIDKYAEVIEGKHVTPELLRATFGTHLYNATKDVLFVQEMMGLNSPLSITKYARKNSVEKKKATNIMSDLIKFENISDTCVSVKTNTNQAINDSDCTEFVIEGDELIRYVGTESSNLVKAPAGVTVVAADAFSRSSVSRVELPVGVRRIGKNAFDSCRNLKEIRLPSTLEEIEPFAFNSCMSLERVVLPDDVKKIGMYAFSRCSMLREITMSPRLMPGSSEYGLPSGCKIKSSEKNTRDFIIEESKLIRYVGTENRNLVKVPTGVTVVAADAFSRSSVSQVELPEGVRKIGKNAFDSCRNLKEIRLPSTLEEIESFAFNSCTSLERVVLPDNVKKVGMYAFSRCSMLREITMSPRLMPGSSEYGLPSDCRIKAQKSTGN